MLRSPAILMSFLILWSVDCKSDSVIPDLDFNKTSVDENLQTVSNLTENICASKSQDKETTGKSFSFTNVYSVFMNLNEVFSSECVFFFFDNHVFICFNNIDSLNPHTEDNMLVIKSTWVDQ